MTESQNAMKQRTVKAIADSQREVNNAKTILADLQQVNTESAPAEELNKYVQTLNYNLRPLAKDFDLLLTGIKILAPNASSGNLEINNIGVPFAQIPTLKVATLNLDGRYKDIQQLKSFIDVLYKKGISIGALVIKGDTFNVTLDIYGL